MRRNPTWKVKLSNLQKIPLVVIERNTHNIKVEGNIIYLAYLKSVWYIL